MPPSTHRLRKFRLNPPQRLAALLLLAFLAQCAWIIAHHTLSGEDYRYAQCGREMWQRPIAGTAGGYGGSYGLPGYYTSCGNIRDGILAYRAAGLPFTLAAHLTPEAAHSTIWELRHELGSLPFLLLTPFALAGLALGACLWWVARRLFGNQGGYLALALYCVSPPILDASTHPNNEILAALGLFALVYTAIGVSHAMQGPAARWRPRILLLTLVFGFTAAAHLFAMLLGLLLAALLMAYLAEGRRAYLPTLLLIWPTGALLLLFAAYGFHPDAFSYLFRSGAALARFSFTDARLFLAAPRHAGLSLVTAAAFALWITNRRSRYFGNTVPLAIALLLFTLQTTGVQSQPWLWAQPFLLLFLSGVFADAFETRQRRLFYTLAAALTTLQAALTLWTLPALAR
ncbi:MAG TPA: hypothetical protein VGD62_08850 [Acidobacteriaceae bacterium]